MTQSVIPADSASCPVLGAAIATGAPYGLALAYADAFQRDCGMAETAAFDALVKTVGVTCGVECAQRIVAAGVDGRMRGRGSRA